jgi:tetratricopeptide (TPR) repeat protein
MPDRRMEDLRRRVEADPTSIAFAALAEEYRRLGRFQDAVDVCRRGLERHPAYLSAKVTLGRSLLQLNRFDEALHELEEVLRIAPENLAALRARGELFQRRVEGPDSRGAAATPSPAQPAGPSTQAERLEEFLAAIEAERQRRGAPEE